jgi:integrase
VLITYSAHPWRGGRTYHKLNAMIRSLKALFNYGISLYDLSIKTPVKGIQLHSVDNKIKYIPPDEDIESVKAVCTPIQRMLIDFCMETGCLANEALKLRMQDVGEDYVILYTRKARHSNLTPRKLPRPECLNGNFNNRIFEEYTTSQPPRFLIKAIRQLGQKPWGFHSLRHRFASLAMKNGMPLIELMYRLGHSNLSTTQIYLQKIGWTEFVAKT